LEIAAIVKSEIKVVSVMFVDFLNLKFKNILSYGKNETVIDFTSGLNQIVGMNGQGKSSILDALSFCLFGQTYRKIKLDELINRKNKKNLLTEVTFVANGDEYRIVRGLKPKVLKVYKNTVEQDELPSTAKTQIEIDNILGIDFALFKEVICLAINYNEPFLILPKNKKRDLVENIFQIGIVSKILAEIKNRQKGVEVDHKLNKSSFLSAESGIESTKKYIHQLETLEENFDKNQERNLKEIQAEIDLCEAQILNCTNGRNKGEELLSTLILAGKDTLINDKAKASAKISEYQNSINKNNRDIALLDDNSTCPHCQSEIDEDHKLKHKEEFEVNNITFGCEIEILKTLIVKLSSDINTETDKENKKRKIETRLLQIDSDLKHNTEKLKSAQDRYKTIGKDKFDTDIESFRKDFSLKEQERDNLKEINTDLLKKIEINTKSIEVLSDNGIKSYLYKKFLPNLNAKINEYINLFALPVSLKFDDMMVESIENMINRKPISYMSFSAGEQKRIDLSIMFSFIQIMKDIANWRCNILFLDEVLDSSTDNDGLQKILESLQNLIYSNPSLCIYVISHRLHSKDLFAKKLRIEKENGFSTVRTDI
jgi:DNA repair exonuclease SbcCD ATPase subunit